MDIMHEVAPLRQDFAESLQQILASEGAMDFTDLDPSGAIETLKAEQAGTRKTTTEQLKRSGLMNTPWGQSLLAQQTMSDIEGRRKIASEFETEAKQRQQELFQTALSLIPGYASGMTLGGLGGVGGATAATTKQEGSGQSSGVSGGFSLK
jgi:hypothetical protein